MRALVVLIAAAAVGFASAPAEASFDACTYDAASRTVTARLMTSNDGRLRVGAGGEIESVSTQCGDATTSNTDAVVVTGSYSSDVITIDESGPGGAFVEPGTSDEIRVDVDFKEETYCPDYSCPGTEQILKLIGTPGDDDIRAGWDGGLLINLDGSSDLDADVHSTGAELEIDGRAGNDTLTGLGGSGAGIRAVSATLRGGPGDDRLSTAGGEDVIYPGGGHDLVYPSISGRDVVSYEDAPKGLRADVSEGVVAADGFGSADAIAPGATFTLRGSGHADRLSASGRYRRSGVHILAGAGDDAVTGTSYSDILEGGPGADRIDGHAAGDSSGYGDTLVGGPGRDVLRGGASSDRLDGGPGNDVLNARRGSEPTVDVGYGVTAGDVLSGGPGSDVLDGGRDDDLYYFGPPEGPELDTIVEGPRRGRDTIEFNYWNLPFEGRPDVPTAIDLSSAKRRFVESGTRVVRTVERAGAAQLENVFVRGFADNRIVGNDARNVIVAYEGVDHVDCRGGRDVAQKDARDRVTNCEVVKLGP